MSGLLTLPNVLAGVILVALTAYVLFGGADFGGGVWDLFARGERRGAQRQLIARAIGPVWEANHVWLILVVTILFTCFPSVFARLTTILHIPITLMLLGIVWRGSAFTFRAYDRQRDSVQQRWSIVFAAASLVTPILLGVCIGAVASGRVGEAAPARGARFVDVYVAPWLSPFSLALGLLTLALFAFLAAVYLTVEADTPELKEDFRRRALAAAGAVFVTAFGALLLAARDAPLMRTGLTASRWALPFHLLTGTAAVAAIGALWTRRWHLARVAAAAQAAFILWGWAIAQYPYLVPPTHRIADAAAPRVTLTLVATTLAVGALVLIPSLAYLLRVFKVGDTAFTGLERDERGVAPEQR